MAVIFTAEGGSLKVEENSAINYYPLDDVRLRTGSVNIEVIYEGKVVHNFPFGDVTPSGASPEIVSDAISALLDTGGGGGGGATTVTWGSPIVLTVTDSGAINIPANASRLRLLFSVNKDKDCWYLLSDNAPVAEESHKVKKNEGRSFEEGEAGTGKVRFITKSGDTTKVTYQEGI